MLPANNTTKPKSFKWPILVRIFHWVGVLLLLTTWIMILMYKSSENGNYIALHKAFGVSVFFWTLARIINRFFAKRPATVKMPKIQTAIAHATHLALYALILAMPLAGMLMSMYAGRAIDVFGLFQLPVLVEPNKSMAKLMNNLHTNIIWISLIVFTGLHFVGAIYHQFIVKDKLINRMC